MFVLERYIQNREDCAGSWKFYASYHDKSLLEKMVAKKKCAEDMGCPYCHTDRDGFIQDLPREGSGRAYIWHHSPIFGGWILRFTGKYRTEAKIKINFCPMCGRQLKESV